MTSRLRYFQERFSVILHVKRGENPTVDVFSRFGYQNGLGKGNEGISAVYFYPARPFVRSPCYARVRHCGEGVSGGAVIESIRTDFAGVHVILLSVKHTPPHQYRVAIKTASKIFFFFSIPPVCLQLAGIFRYFIYRRADDSSGTTTAGFYVFLVVLHCICV